MRDFSKAIDTAFQKRERLILIGLTGRTGSGCTTVANILKKKSTSDLDLHDKKTQDFKNLDERKYSITKKYMEEEGRWKPFTIIEVSSIILSFVLEIGMGQLHNYLDDLVKEKEKHIIKISDYEKLNLGELDYMFQEAKKYPISNIDDLLKQDDTIIESYFNYYTKTIVQYRDRIKDMLNAFSCREIIKSKVKETKIKKYHLYTFLMQKFGNNIRCSGEPYSELYSEDKYYALIGRVNDVIKIINRYYENNKDRNIRVCVDAIRNPFEAHYLKDRYRAFYLIAINTEDEDRVRRLRLNMNEEEISNLDKVEYPNSSESPEEIFYHQNIQSCLEIADIHITNNDTDNGKYYYVTEQILKYIALMLHPGLVTPTNVEWCMQLAYNVKYNSGCLSRQVGAVVTGEDFTVKSVGWNDVPKGQIACNLRDIKCYCLNKDAETYSDYECTDRVFGELLEHINNRVQDKQLKGRSFSFCFKDVYNGIKKTKNQVYTRALHAEENAFLQISKYGGQGVQNGKLFTTASPCELCAKKAYQLGIKEIYYIDPYPGISKNHILKFGKSENPEMILFSGAIGDAYLSLFSPRMAMKDEIELMTGISISSEVENFNNMAGDELGVEDIKYSKIELNLRFVDNKNKIICTREGVLEVLKDQIEKINKMMVWTGSSYDGTTLISSEPKCTLVEGVKKDAYYHYSIVPNKPILKGEGLSYKIQTDVKDEKEVMEPYFSHWTKYRTDLLIIRVTAPKNLLTNVKGVEYADLKMETKFNDIEVIHDSINNEDIFVITKEHPNLFYSYTIEWEFMKIA